ncbi:MAG: GGDEF domain-containing protein, partial [Clostridia bacterium]|nr:GGDEF domain-containing protein [Clostridia bacterium]
SAETLLSKIKEPFIEGSKRKESFEIIETAAGKTYLIRFLALQDVKGIPVGYFIGVKENQTLAIEKQDFFIECSLVTLLMILFFATSLVYVRSQVRINEISMRDNLTKLYNRHKFNTFAESELQRCKRYGGNFSLLMIDIDFFKRVNDTYGHLQGDAVLKELAEIFINTLRVNDLVARWGGEEFICCLPNTNGEEAMIVAEKLRKRVEDNVFNIVGHITISIGATEVTADDDNLNGPIARADDGLYASKHNGRNKVTLM